FVVLGFRVGSREELQDRRAHLDAIPVRQGVGDRDLLLVDVRPVGAVVVDDEPLEPLAIEVRVAARYAVALEDDVVVRSPPHADRALLQDETFAQQRGLRRVDHDEAIRARTGSARWLLNHLRDPCLFVVFGQRVPSWYFWLRPPFSRSGGGPPGETLPDDSVTEKCNCPSVSPSRRSPPRTP